MRILVAISLLSLVFSCAHKDAGKGLVKLSGRNSSAANITAESGTLFDSTFFVGYVDYFPETKEFYTALFYREGREYPDEDLLEAKLDSVIIFDDDWGRERLPMEEARKLLVLNGLDTLSIFNRKNELVCHCPLTRVEYLWNGLESYFIAVFESDGKFFEQTEELYGISSDFPVEHLALLSVQEITDGQFNEFLQQKLDISHTREWDMRHYRIAPQNETYSVVSSFSMTSNEALSYLTLSENNAVQILNTEVNNYHYLNILPVPIQMNGKPLLLISAGYPSSDVLWDYLAGFDGTRYEAIDHNRIHVKDLSGKWEHVVAQAVGY